VERGKPAGVFPRRCCISHPPDTLRTSITFRSFYAPGTTMHLASSEENSFVPLDFSALVERAFAVTQATRKPRRPLDLEITDVSGSAIPSVQSRNIRNSCGIVLPHP